LTYSDNFQIICFEQFHKETVDYKSSDNKFDFTIGQLPNHTLTKPYTCYITFAILPTFLKIAFAE